MHINHMSSKVFNFNGEFTLIKFINFHVIAWVFTDD